MADGIVLNSSAALAVLLGEPGAAPVRKLIARNAGSPLLVLDLFWLEVVNVLLRRHGWDADAVVEAVRELDELGIETVAPDRPMLLATLDLATTLGLSAYDAAPLALAEAADVALLTLDAGLARAAGPRSAMRPGRRTREMPASDGPRPAIRPDWARHGGYLAELRRMAVADA